MRAYLICPIFFYQLFTLKLEHGGQLLAVAFAFVQFENPDLAFSLIGRKIKFFIFFWVPQSPVRFCHVQSVTVSNQFAQSKDISQYNIARTMYSCQQQQRDTHLVTW